MDHVADVRTSQRVPKTPSYIRNTHLRNRFQTATATALTPMVHISTVYLTKLCAIFCAKVGYMDVDHTLVVF
jgi:hypothetical protein